MRAEASTGALILLGSRGHVDCNFFSHRQLLIYAFVRTIIHSFAANWQNGTTSGNKCCHLFVPLRCRGMAHGALNSSAYL